MNPTLPQAASTAASRQSPAIVLALGALLVATLPGLVAARDGGHDHGGFTHRITTSSTEAQEQFDQGLLLAWGFNHLEAARAFRKAAEADPQCAMCWWGVALVLGPNINAALDPKYYPEILEALAKAKALSAKATDAERAYINALEARYPPTVVEDRSRYDKAYADAMRRVARKYSDDLDAGALFAEALMDTTPWDYWKPNGDAKGVTREFIDVLESILRRDAKHSGAAHLLIHAVEKGNPAMGVPAAERLDNDPQATGHLVHMASHIYMRVGRYDDAERVNKRAIEEDDEYAAHHQVPDEYFPYMLHNHHMRWAALGLEGRRNEAYEEAKYLQGNLPDELLRVPAFAMLQHFWSIPLYTQVWFSDWQAVLAAPEPPADLLYPVAVWHYARGVAQAREGNVEAARTELGALREATEKLRRDEGLIWGLNPGSALLDIGASVLAGEVAAAGKDYPTALRELQQAVTREDALVYDEPPPFLSTSRLNLGRVQLAAHKPAEAEKTFRDDLKVYALNGWSLSGLATALEAQGKTDEARKVRAQLADAWQKADAEQRDGAGISTAGR